MSEIANYELNLIVWFGRDKGVHAFPKDISLKLNVIAWLEFKLDVIVQHVNQYATETPQTW